MKALSAGEINLSGRSFHVNRPKKKIVSANKTIPSYRLMFLLVACIPILLSIITITQLQLNFTALLLPTVAVYFAIYIKLLFVVYGEAKLNIFNIAIWSFLVFMIFPFGCLIFLIVNWKALSSEEKIS